MAVARTYVIIFNMQSPGEEKAWEVLGGLHYQDVCKNAAAAYDSACMSYLIRSFCWEFSVSPEEKVIKSSVEPGKILIERYGYFFRHSCLWYLIYAKYISLTGKLVKPSDIKGGEMFFRGSHVLPLSNIANKYGNDTKAFLNRGAKLCAELLDYGDASLRLWPMPRIPVIIILRLGDEEFPPRVDLLLDSTCELHIPLDITWSIAMMSALVML
jgi:hypothetical protein